MGPPGPKIIFAATMSRFKKPTIDFFFEKVCIFVLKIFKVLIPEDLPQQKEPLENLFFGMAFLGFSAAFNDLSRVPRKYHVRSSRCKPRW